MYNATAMIRSEERALNRDTSRVFRWWDYVLFLVLTALNFAAFAYFLSRWFALPDWQHHSLIFGVLTLAIFHNLLMYQLRWLTLPLMRMPRPISPSPGWKVGVATTFVPGAESISMLEVTLKA